jgi:hypothetical protein
VRADDEARREFVFLSILRSQPAISWVAFGFPDGRFFGAQKRSDGEIHMVELYGRGRGRHPAAAPRPLRSAARRCHVQGPRVRRRTVLRCRPAVVQVRRRDRDFGLVARRAAFPMAGIAPSSLCAGRALSPLHRRAGRCHRARPALGIPRQARYRPVVACGGPRRPGSGDGVERTHRPAVHRPAQGRFRRSARCHHG